MKTSRFPKFQERVCSEFLDNSHSLENVRLLSKSPYLTGHIKMDYETGYIERFSEKKTEMYPGPLRHLRWSSLWH